MVHAGMAQDVHQRANRPCLRIPRAEDQRTDTAMHHGACAHHAGFEGDIKGGIQQAVVLQHQSALTQRHDFRVRRGVVTADGPVPPFADRLVFIHQHGADRNFPFIPGAPGKHQRVAHPVFMGKFTL